MNNISFFAWIDSIASSPMGKYGADKGFSIFHSGGGCHHFYKENKTHFVLICEESSIPDQDNMDWQVGLYPHNNEDGAACAYYRVPKQLNEVFKFADFALEFSDILWTATN